LHQGFIASMLMEQDIPYDIFPLGDSAITIDLGNRICATLNDKVLAIQQWMTTHPFEGLKDMILGYSSLSILFDPIVIQRKQKSKVTAFQFVKEKLETAFSESEISYVQNREEIMLPVCYDAPFGPDLSFIAEMKQMSVEEIISIHLSKPYRIYMMGFLPGFAYMGEVDKRIQVPRKQKPEAVMAGTVGIANGQTGIYPLDSPGGWQVIARTPIKLFDAEGEQPVKLRAGQSVRFHRINETEFHYLASQQ
jgi:inhibitor of KinA